MGYQYFLYSGPYPDYQWWMGFNASFIMSSWICLQPLISRISHRMRIYRCAGGYMKEFADDRPYLYDHFHYSDVHSCTPNYRGRKYCLRHGEYRSYRDRGWGMRISFLLCLFMLLFHQQY
uniref:Beta/gamma crystallin 'Greek key' domain-containing protein n=1 Tax=Electrophorus electricus TaxID=8005 RepID=A0A4W4EJC8_ELEEL